MRAFRFTNNRDFSPLTNEQLMNAAPSVFADKPYEKMSDRYRFVPTIDIVNALRDNGLHPVKAMESRTRTEEKKGFVKHLIRFRHNNDMRAFNQGDEIPEIVLVNSHDGSTGYNLLAGIFRLVCANGMIAQTENLGSLKVRHMAKDAHEFAQNVIDGTYKIIEETPVVMQQIEYFKSIELTPAQQNAFAEAAMTIKPIDHIKPIALLTPHRMADKPNTDGSRDLWKTMNVVQENMIRGGLRGINPKTHRRISTRAVQAVSEDVRINKMLWTFTESLSKQVA